MSRLHTLVLISLAMLCAGVHAQDLPLNNHFAFTDGIYLSYDDFLQNKPSIPIQQVKFKEKKSRFFDKIKINKLYVREKDTWKKYKLSQIWGICIKGMPHIQYEVQNPRMIKFGQLSSRTKMDGDFVRLRIIGALCHFHIEDYSQTQDLRPTINVSNYSNFENATYVSSQKILQLETGLICDFNAQNIGILIQDDEKLFQHYKKNEKKKEKIFLYLQKYNERNPSYCMK